MGDETSGIDLMRATRRSRVGVEYVSTSPVVMVTSRIQSVSR